MDNNLNEKPLTENNTDNAQVKKTSLGMEENIEGLLCYLFGWISGLIFLFAEKNSKFVKFHAVQSLILGASVSIIYIVLNRLFIFSWSLWAVISFITGLIGIGYLILSVYLMIKAYKKEQIELPLIGKFAKNAANKNS